MVGKYGRFNFGLASKMPASPYEDDEFNQISRELNAVKAALADREKALERAALEAQRIHVSWEQKLSNAEKAWRAEESARLAAAEAQWRQQSKDALAEVSARCAAAERRLEQLSQEPAGEGSSFFGSRPLEQSVNHDSEFETLPSPAVRA